MSGYILCRTKRAKTPWYIESIGLHIYSIEELCYFICENLPLVDKQIFGEDLFSWMASELELNGLAKRLYGISQREYSLSDMLIPIFREINYLNTAELNGLEKSLTGMEKMPEMVRLKKRGDALMICKKYIKAIDCYSLALQMAAEEKAEPAITGSLYHNCGCSYVKLFQMDEAVECFRLAYEMLHSRKVLKSYLYAIYLKEGVTGFELLCRSMEVDEKTREEIMSEIGALKTEEPPADPEAALAEWTREYHRNTDM